MDTELTEALSRLNTFSGEELSALEERLVARGRELLDDPTTDLAEIREVKAAVDSVRATAEELAELPALVAQLRAEIEGVEPKPEPVAASAKPGALNKHRPKAMTPRPQSGNAGEELAELRELGERFAQKVDLLRGHKGGGRAIVASAQATYPEARTLTSDWAGNTQRLLEVVSEQALVASGGLCAPTNVRYDMSVVASAARPVRDALAGFGADRGGVRFVSPPHLADVAPGVSVWSETNDTTPGSDGPATKPVVTITCGSAQEVLVDAIVARARVGNFARRTFPEQWATWYALLRAQHARIAEQNLLDAISAGSVQVTDGQNLGAARDLLEAWGRAAAAYRNRQRMESETKLRLLVPAWSRDMIRADLTRELPGSPTDRLALANAQIAGFFSALNIVPAFYLDQRSGGGQLFGAQANGALAAWPTVVESYLFHEGAWLFLDGGVLDLGVEIRDTTLNATNDVEAFFESFENAAFVGVESVRIRSNVCVSGESSAAQDIACPTLGS